MALAVGIGICVLVIVCIYVGIGWWITSDDGTHGRERFIESLKMPALFLAVVVMLAWDSFRDRNETDQGWD